MQTLRSFIEMLALKPLAVPLARAALRRGQPCRALADCLPDSQRLVRAGRDIHFHPGLVPGRLVVVDMLYGNAAGILGTGRGGVRPFMYALTEQPDPGTPAALRLAMQVYAEERAGGYGRAEAGDVDVLRSRLVLVRGDG